MEVGLDAPIPAALEAGQQIHGAWAELPESVKDAVMEAIPAAAHNEEFKVDFGRVRRRAQSSRSIELARSSI